MGDWWPLIEQWVIYDSTEGVWLVSPGTHWDLLLLSHSVIPSQTSRPAMSQSLGPRALSIPVPTLLSARKSDTSVISLHPPLSGLRLTQLAAKKYMCVPLCEECLRTKLPSCLQSNFVGRWLLNGFRNLWVMSQVLNAKWTANRQSYLLLQFPRHDYKKRESIFSHKSHTHTCLHTHINTHQRAYRSRSICPSIFTANSTRREKKKSLCRYMYTCCMCVHECVRFKCSCLLSTFSGWHHGTIRLLSPDDTSTGGQANSGMMTALCWPFTKI